jgi:signal transduction histidine kinase
MYSREYKNIEIARKVIEEKSLSVDELWEAYQKMTDKYVTLVDDSKFLTKISDRLQNKLVAINNDLESKQLDLEQLNEVNAEQNNELRAIKHTLEEKVISRTQDLKQINEELKASNAELDNFTYRVAHDINGPISRVIGLSDLALMENSTESLSYLEKINGVANHLKDILDRILYANTVKKKEISMTNVNIQGIFSQVVDKVSYLKNFPSTSFSLKVKEGLCFMSDDKILHILMESLVEHAIKNIVVESIEKPYVHIRIAKEQECLQLYLAYTGVEIPEEHTKNIFKMFHRTSNNPDVLGMELYMAYLSTQKLGGKLEVISSNQQETILSLFLPDLV